MMLDAFNVVSYQINWFIYSDGMSGDHKERLFSSDIPYDFDKLWINFINISTFILMILDTKYICE